MTRYLIAYVVSVVFIASTCAQPPTGFIPFGGSGSAFPTPDDLADVKRRTTDRQRPTAPYPASETVGAGSARIRSYTSPVDALINGGPSALQSLPYVAAPIGRGPRPTGRTPTAHHNATRRAVGQSIGR